MISCPIWNGANSGARCQSHIGPTLDAQMVPLIEGQKELTLNGKWLLKTMESRSAGKSRQILKKKPLLTFKWFASGRLCPLIDTGFNEWPTDANLSKPTIKFSVSVSRGTQLGRPLSRLLWVACLFELSNHESKTICSLQDDTLAKEVHFFCTFLPSFFSATMSASRQLANRFAMARLIWWLHVNNGHLSIKTMSRQQIEWHVKCQQRTANFFSPLTGLQGKALCLHWFAKEKSRPAWPALNRRFDCHPLCHSASFLLSWSFFCFVW